MFYQLNCFFFFFNFNLSSTDLTIICIFSGESVLVMNAIVRFKTNANGHSNLKKNIATVLF